MIALIAAAILLPTVAILHATSTASANAHSDDHDATGDAHQHGADHDDNETSTEGTGHVGDHDNETSDEGMGHVEDANDNDTEVDD